MDLEHNNERMLNISWLCLLKCMNTQPSSTMKQVELSIA